MKSPLRVLLVEDSESDANLIVRELERNGYQTKAQRVDRAEEMSSALSEDKWDLVLCDFSMPGFGGLAALDLVRRAAIETPFIFVSGTIGEDMAVEATKNGASDYVLKGNLKRLVPSIHRALREVQTRREQSQAEDSLRKSERRFRKLASSAPVGIFETNALGAYTYVNSRWCEMTGTPTEISLGDAWISSMHPEDCASVLEVWNEAVHRRAESCCEYRYLHRDGSIVWVIGKAAPLVDETGKLLGFTGTLTEVTDQKQSERARLEAEAKFRQLVERSLVGIYIIQDEKFAYVNPKMVEIFGCSETELTSLPLLQFIHENDHEAVRKNIHERIEGSKESIRYHLRGRRRDGGTIVLEAHGGKTVYLGKPAILGTLLDITDRRRSEEQIRDQARLLDLAQDAILVRNLDNRIQYWNHAAERLYGWNFEEIQTQDLSEKQFPNIEDFLAAKSQTLAKGEWNGELRQRRKDGGDLIVSSRWTLLRDEQKRPRAILSINTDITDKKKLESQFLRAQRLDSIGTLASGIAHDLNNVLAPIVMAATLLRMRANDDEVHKLVSLVDASASRAVDVVKQLLTFARGTDSKHGKVELPLLIKDILKVAGATFPKSIQLASKIPLEIWPVSGDTTHLHQVLLNLCVNARDAMPHGGKITIHVENLFIGNEMARTTPDAKPGRYVAIKVIDTGTGIPAALIEKIFDPFFTTKEVGKGTGLGLSTVLGIVKNHHGFVQVQSEQNKGSEFCVYLPAVSSLAETPPKRSPLDLPSGHGETILVVDDEAILRMMTRDILNRFGYEVVLASDGAEAVIEFAKHRSEIKLVLTDLMMPVMDGTSLVRVIKRMNPDIPVIMSSGLETGTGKSPQAEELKNLGVTNFLLKPVPTEKLLVTIRDMLQTS